MSAWGHVRATDDIGFISSLEPHELQKLLSASEIPTELKQGDVVAGDLPWVLHGKVGQVKFQVLPPLVPLAWDKAMLVSMPDGAELRVVDLPDLIRLKLRAGGTRDLWDAAVLLQKHPNMRDAARQWTDDVGRLKELDAWLGDARLG